MKFEDYINEATNPRELKGTEPAEDYKPGDIKNKPEKRGSRLNTANTYVIRDRKTKQFVADGFINWRRKEGETNPTVPNLTNNIHKARRFPGTVLNHYKVPDNYDIIEDLYQRKVFIDFYSRKQNQYT